MDLQALTQSPAVVIVSFAIGVVGLIIGIVSLRGIREKRLVYQCTTRPLVALPSTLTRIKLLYDDVPVARVSFTRLSVANAGREAIRAEDLSAQAPLRLTFPPNTRIFGTGFLEPAAKANAIKPAVSGSHVDIGFDFLNRHDGFVMDIIHDGAADLNTEFTGVIKSGALSSLADSDSPLLTRAAAPARWITSVTPKAGSARFLMYALQVVSIITLMPIAIVVMPIDKLLSLFAAVPSRFRNR